MNLILGAGCSYDLTVALRVPTDRLRIKMASRIEVTVKASSSPHANQWSHSAHQCNFVDTHATTPETHTFLAVGLLDNPLITCKKQLVHEASESKVITVAVRKPG